MPRPKTICVKKLFSDEFIKSKPDGLENKFLSDTMSLVSYNNVLDAKLFIDLLVRCNHSLSSISDRRHIAGCARAVARA